MRHESPPPQKKNKQTNKQTLSCRFERPAARTPVNMKRQWCIGNIEASQALAPGSTPGWRIFGLSLLLGAKAVFLSRIEPPENREDYRAGYRLLISGTVCGNRTRDLPIKTQLLYPIKLTRYCKKNSKKLQGRESNPGFLRDRQEY